MPKVALHILYRAMILHVRGRAATKRLVGHVTYSGFLRQWLQMPLQVIADTECCSDRAWKQERARIIAIWMPRDPRLNLPCEIRWDWNVVVALLCFCVSNPILAFLALLQRFVDSELRTPEI